MSTEIVTLTRPGPTIWLLTLNSPPDNRLSPALLTALSAHLDTVEAEWRAAGGAQGGTGPGWKPKGAHGGKGAVVISGGEGRFFSNGLDYERAMRNPRFFEEVYDPALWRLLTFPLVTIAAVNGHAFAGGMVLALACDFRIMTGGKGMMCMNELSFGSPIPNSFAAFLRLRLPTPAILRDTLLGRRWVQADLLKEGMIDEIVQEEGGAAVLDRAVEWGVREGAKSAPGSWGSIKASLYYEIIEASRSDREVLMPTMEAERFWKRVGKEPPEKAKL